MHSQFSRMKNDKKHRVLIYLTCYNVIDGVSLTIRKIENELLDCGHSVCILTTQSGNRSNTHMHMKNQHHSQDLRWHVHLPNKHPNRTVIFVDHSYPIPFFHDPNNPDNSSYHIGFSISNEVKTLLDEFGPTIVHMTVPDVTSMHVINYARSKQIPLMGTYHSNVPDYFTHYTGIGWVKYLMAAYNRHQYNFLQAMFVPTPYIRRHLSVVDEYYRFDKVTTLNVWGRGVDLERFHPSRRSKEFRQQYRFTNDDVVITWVGRLVPEKRPDIFAYVVRKLAKDNAPFKALVIGAGPNEDQMKAMKLPNTTFAGWLSGDELATAYASSDIFLFPSAVETFGNVTLEAAASGLPLVVDSGCSGHLVHHGVNGFACSEDDLESYYVNTRCLVFDDKKRKLMSTEGRKSSLNYENLAVCRKMINNYTMITEEFYGTYDGDHKNRDQIYETMDESFLGGTYVRPACIILVEHICIVLLSLFYKILALYVKTSSFFRRNCVNQKISLSFPGSETSSTYAVAATSGSYNIKAGEEEKTNDSVSTDSYQQTVDNSYVTATKLNLTTTQTKSSGDDTDSTDSSVLNFDDMLVPSINLSCESVKFVQQNRLIKIEQFWRSDLPFTHNISIFFVQVMILQARIECRVRKIFTTQRCFFLGLDDKVLADSNSRNDIQNRKRKDSEEITLDDCNDMLLARQCNESLQSIDPGYSDVS